MAVMKFADGERLIDDPFVGPLNQATDGAPEKFTFPEAMKRVNRVFEGNILREASAKVLREHFGRPWEP